jgi:hypothetical protein
MSTAGGPTQPEDKLAELLLYVADQSAAGSAKVNKILFFAECTHVRRTGRPITGVEYQKIERGPAPRRLRPVRTDLVRQGSARVQEEMYLGYVQHRLVPLRPAHTELFEPSELEAVDEVLAMYHAHTGADLSAISHEEPAWPLFAEGETIPYAVAFLSGDTPGESVLAHAKELAERYR